MLPLKLPEYQPRIRGDEKQEIFCLARKKYVALTPEEWVRQHFLNLLIEHLKYPKGMIRLEHSLTYFQRAKRSDIVILDREGELFLLVECKSYDVALDQKILAQIATYNKILDAKYLAITNGLKHYFWQKTDGFDQMTKVPQYPQPNR